jgi:hypothetical protein
MIENTSGFTGCERTNVLYQDTTLQLAKKGAASRGMVPQRLKPDSLQSISVRPEGRTLQKHEFFRKLFSQAVTIENTSGLQAAKKLLFCIRARL